VVGGNRSSDENSGKFDKKAVGEVDFGSRVVVKIVAKIVGWVK
jgi:hypothetical protein